MDCKRVVFSGHAIRRMFERVSRDDVLAVIAQAETVIDYAYDKPYPSQLLLGYLGATPLHRCSGF